MAKYDKILQNILNKIKPIINNDTVYFNLVDNLKIVKFHNDVLYIETNSDKALDFIKNNYYETFLHVVRKEFESSDLDIKFGTGNNWIKNIDSQTSQEIQSDDIKHFGLINTDKKLTFDNYILTKDSKKIKETLITLFTKEKYKDIRFPIFIYGNSGIGKTHLVNAYANYMHDINKDLNIFCITGVKLEQELIDASKSQDSFKTINELRKKLLMNDVVIVDDFQMFAEKNIALKIFFDIFNDMKEKNIILILTSDRKAESINGLTDRFMSRICGGIKIQMPTLAVDKKSEFLDKLIKSNELDLNLDNQTKEFLCDFYVKDIRSLIGALCSLEFASFGLDENETLKLDEVIKILDIKTVINQTEKCIETNITPDLIVNAIAMKYGIKSELIMGKGRAKNVVSARNLIFYILNKKLNLNHGKISEIFNKDRTTITTSLKKNTSIFDRDKKIQSIIDSIFKELHS